MSARGRHDGPTCQAGAGRYTGPVAKRDPHVVLGVEQGATPQQIKAAWRRLARAHHPDLTGDDPAASRVATRQMAEINDAYAALTRDDGTGRRSADGTSPGADGASFDGATTTRRRGGPPRPKPTRPVTGRVDTTSTYRPRNEVAGEGRDRRSGLPGQPPVRGEIVDREPPRASTPTGPAVRGRIRHYRRPAPPSLDMASEHVAGFGKFHGHTLGQIAAFEPSYIDWLAGTVTRDPDLVAAARVIQADLDRRGVVRRARPTPERPRHTA
jgi:curved DNA-binding protein CbpA